MPRKGTIREGGGIASEPRSATAKGSLFAADAPTGVAEACSTAAPSPSRMLLTGWVRLRARQREAILQALELRIDDFERRAVAARDKEDDEATWAAYLRLR